MGLGVGIFLIAVGAILTFAVNATTSGVNVDAVGPLTGGIVSLLALISGTWFPVTHGFLHDLGQCFPSYWLVQAGRLPVDGHAWGATGWLVVLGWAVVLVVLAGFAYRRDTKRV